MTVVYPLTNFVTVFGELDANTQPFWLMRRQEMSRTAGGVSLGKDIGPALWMASVVTTPKARREAMALAAWLNSLDGYVGTFILGDSTRPFPASDPTGAHPATVQIAASSDGEISLKGLPANFVLTPGDMLSFSYGTGNAGYALHEVVESVTANGSGVTASFAVRPAIRAGTTSVDRAVSLKVAPAEFRLDSWSSQYVGDVLMRFTIEATQVVR